MENPFENPKPSQEDQAIEKNIKALVEQSGKCLNNKDFEQYRVMYYKFRDSIYKQMDECDIIDRDKFTVFCKVNLAKLDVLNKIIAEVEGTAVKAKRRLK